MGKPLSVRKFALEIGVSHTAVWKALKTGRLIESIHRDAAGKFKGIDSELGPEEWTANCTKPVSRKVAEQNKEPEPRPSPVYAAPAQVTVPEPDAELEAEPAAIENPAGLPSYSESRALRENYQAKISKLVFEEKMGQLVSAEDVKTRAFEISRLVRDTVLNLPSRISAELAAETNPDLIYSTLTRELTQALDGLSAEILKQAAGDGDE
jgi:hypothetical protein